MTRKRKSKLRLGLVGTLLVLLLTWAFWPRPELVDIAAVERSPLIVTLDEEGETRVRDRFVVSAPLAGRPIPGARASGSPSGIPRNAA